MLTVIYSRAMRGIAAAWLAVALTGCSSLYVDNTIKEVPAAGYQKPAQPQPVQLFFEFQTKGVLNQQATGHVKARVADQIRASGLFSEVAEAPVAGGATLSVVVNNVPMNDDAYSKAFITGMTFGLAGTQVGDGYVCTSVYRAPGASTPIQKSTRNAIYANLGNTSAPVNADKVDSIDEAITRVLRASISQLLNETSRDPAFK